jgi:hypothetical protein
MSIQLTETTCKAAVVWLLFLSAPLAALAGAANGGGVEGISSSSTQAGGAMQENSGLRGQTMLIVGSGAEYGEASKSILSLEFAVVPIDGETAQFDTAKYVKSDPDGTFQLILPPGKYQIVSKEKALNPEEFKNIRRRPPIRVVEQTVFVQAGAFTEVDVIQSGPAP